MEKVTKDGIAYDPDICPVRQVLDGIGDKWTILVVATLKPGSKRFSELKRIIGDISQRMLTQTLRKLERDGMVNRTVTPSIPPRVDYELTDLGHSLTGQLEPLANWALEHRETIAIARAEYDARDK